MKKLRLFIIVVILFIVKSTYAQNEITGFLELNLVIPIMLQ